MALATLLMTSLWAAPGLWAEELPSVARADIILAPPNRSLRNALRDQLEQYRESLRAINLSPRASRLAQGERQRMMRLLESRGYYDAEVIYRIVETGDGNGERLQYRVDLGPQYEVLSVSVEGVDVELPDDWPLAGEGDPLVAETILSDQSSLQAIVDDQGCYFRLSVTHQVELAESEPGGRVSYQVTAAEPSRFSQVTFSGHEGVSEPFLRRQTDLDSGACFSRADVDQAVINLYQTQLFATVRRSLERQDDGDVQVRFDLVQRAHRTVRAGAGWDTDRGFGVNLGWEHRNLWGRAQWLELGTEIWTETQSANAQITLPGFLEARNTLVWNNTLTHETPENAEYYIGESRATISRQASRNDTYSYGVAYRRSDERTGDDWDTFSLLRLPLSYEFDENPGSLDPRSGVRYRVDLEPVWSLSGSSDPFTIGTLGWSSFRSLSDDWVLANRLYWTSLWPLTDSADLDRIPPSDRLLAGGGGSVRGYPYRSIGVDGTSEGGTQEWEGSLELRGRFGGNWGAVLFTDVASVSEEWNPTRNQDWFAGAGVGVRYYTRFAPIRFDVAVPVNPRDSDPAFQIYLSLGHSF